MTDLHTDLSSSRDYSMAIYLLAHEPTILFIDGVSIYNTSRNIGVDVDYRRLLDYFRSATHVIRAYYYSTIVEGEEYTPVKPLSDWLSYNGFFTVIKSVKEFVDHSGKRRIKGNTEIEMAIDMMELAPHAKHFVLFTGNSEFRRVVESVQKQGIRVTVVSSLKASLPTIGDELRRQCDQFVDLADIGENFSRQGERNVEDRTGVERILRSN